MGTIVDLGTWRRSKRLPEVEHPREGSSEQGLARLDRAVERLYRLASQALDAGGSFEPPIETELLAIMGELTVGSVQDAADRAERLADRLSLRKRARRG
jgi:hypothetical protein